MGDAGHIATAPDGPMLMALVFRAGALLCALPLEEVIETMRPLPVQPIAGTRPFVLGISVMRGVATPVVDVARLLGGRPATVSRFVSVRTGRSPAAFATGEVLGIRPVGDTHGGRANAALLGGAPVRLVAAVGTFGGGPLLVLQSTRLLADEIWADGQRADGQQADGQQGVVAAVGAP